MGLTAKSTGLNAMDSGLNINRDNGAKVIALAGNPNVGKSTVFNALTGLNQHTGNWPGKTVSNAQGSCIYKSREYILVDLPGTYSLMAHSTEEEVARDFICFGEPDAVIVVCDATCLERNLNLVLQTIEITSKVIVCVNLLDEAKKKNIIVDLEKLSQELGVSVIGCTARSNKGLDRLQEEMEKICSSEENKDIPIKYTDDIEYAISIIEPIVKSKIPQKLSSRWIAIKLMDFNDTLYKTLSDYLSYDLVNDEDVKTSLVMAKKILEDKNINEQNYKDTIISTIIKKAESVSEKCIEFKNSEYFRRDQKIDKLLTNRWLGIPLMILLLLIVFWITITGANYPSELLSKGLFWLGDRMTDFFHYINTPEWVNSVVVLGIYRVLAWVVSVMLPPMAIFFPLFTLLEDSGYLPRVAFNLDKHFKKACACGKQSLTMCMGFGCNAAGIVGCRIIDSPRERLIATLTNNFVPCNGRFPTIIAMISMFFIIGTSALSQSVLSAICLTAVIVLGIIMTFLSSKLLSKTLLKGVPSSFTLELPPYRRPQILKVLVRSIFDRTLFVLGRACCVAAPCGLIIWLFANINIGDLSLLTHCCNFLDPIGHFIGLDGVILFAFILGFPANEIVIPIIIMSYMNKGYILDISELSELKNLLVDNGWTWLTALCMIIFSLMHWPCSTSILTIKKETQSLKWPVVAFLLPTCFGFAICAIIANLSRLIGLV